MMYEVIMTAIAWWCSERKSSINSNVMQLLSFVFYTLDSLYLSTRGLPVPSANYAPNLKLKLNGIQGTLISPPSSYVNYLYTRTSLALVSDLYSLLETLKLQGNLMEITQEIDQLYAQADSFRDIRNFYTHLDERLVDRKKHGINGPLQTNYGIIYGPNAREEFHLIVHQHMIYFTDYNQAKATDVSQTAFNPLFETAMRIYDIVTSHVSHSTTYPEASSLYPLTTASQQ